MNKLLTAAIPLTALLAACSPGAQTPSLPAAASVTLTGPASLKLNAPTQLSASARDASGSVITGKTFTWSSSDPNVVSVDGSGTVTAKRLSVSPVTLTASADGQSAPLNVTTYGLELTMGTYNRDPGESDAKVGTAILLKFRKANGKGPDADASATFTGPSGFDPSIFGTWTVYKNDQPATIWSWTVNQPPVAGSYSAAATVDGESYAASASLNPSLLLPGYTSATLDITARTATTTTFNFTGTPDPQIKAVRPALFNDTDFFSLYFFDAAALPLNEEGVEVAVKDGTYTKAAYAINTIPWKINTITPPAFNMSKVNIGTVTLP